MKTQLKQLQEVVESLSVAREERQPPPSGGRKEDLIFDSEFPTLSSWNPEYNKALVTTGNPTHLGSWKDKVTSSNAKIGMPLKFVIPLVENGEQIMHIDTLDLENLVNVWEKVVVFYVVGENVTVDIIRGFIRKHWFHVQMPIIHPHKEGYFMLKFST